MGAGRPRKPIDKAQFEGLLSIQCTLDEVTAFFDQTLNGCSPDTIERWCMRTYGEKFADVSRKKRSVGRISLRRQSFEMAKHSPAVMIFLLKNYCNMSDSGMVAEAAQSKDDALSRSLEELAERGIESDD